MEGYVPVQYITKNTKCAIVINDTQEDRAYIEELLCKMLGIKKTVGKVTFGDSTTNKEEALAYNRGFEAGLATTIKNMEVIDGPDIYVEGEKLITGPKKRKNSTSLKKE
jgi:hypothetical protein